MNACVVALSILATIGAFDPRDNVEQRPLGPVDPVRSLGCVIAS
jgi:hypothetical protein